jgi:hypothetical protein
MTNQHTDEMRAIVSDERLARVFTNTNFGNAKPREIVAETLLKIAGGFSTGNTALVCCQELALVGRNKINPRLTKLGKRYLYYSHATASAEAKYLPVLEKLVEALTIYRRREIADWREKTTTLYANHDVPSSVADAALEAAAPYHKMKGV